MYKQGSILPKHSCIFLLILTCNLNNSTLYIVDNRNGIKRLARESQWESKHEILNALICIRHPTVRVKQIQFLECVKQLESMRSNFYGHWDILFVK